MALAKPQRSLNRWTKEDWQTASGKPSTQGKDATGEAYMPAAKARQLKSTPAGRRKIARANAVKRKAKAAGQQYARHGLHKGKKA